MDKPANLNQTPQYQAALAVIKVLEDAGFQARMVGGCVRDRLLGLKPKDYDLATDALPEQALKLFDKKPFKVIATGLAHGTVTVVYQRIPIEVTSLRKDIRTNGRHAEVEFGGSFADDAARRDFTINAMYEDRHGELYDYYQGQEHLRAKKLFFVGDAKTRLHEDYLRVLRFFRFKSRYALESDLPTLQALKEACQGLAIVSQERITSELWEIFSETNLSGCLKAMLEAGVLRQALSQVLLGADVQLSDSFFVPFSQIGEKLAKEHRARARLALLFFWQREKTLNSALTWTEEEALERLRLLKLSTAHMQAIAFAVSGACELPEPGSDIAAKLDFIDRCEKAAGSQSWSGFYLPLWQEALPLLGGKGLKLFECLKLVDAAEQGYGHRRLKRMPVQANQLMSSLQLEAGPELGKLLEYLKRTFRNGEWQTLEEAKEHARQYRIKKTAAGSE